jgi:hypothetical protein
MAGLSLQTRQEEEEEDHPLLQEFTGSKTAATAAAGNCKHTH